MRNTNFFSSQYILKVVEKINYEIYDRFKDEYEDYNFLELDYSSNGYEECVSYLGIPIWSGQVWDDDKDEEIDPKIIIKQEMNKINKILGGFHIE